MSFVCRPWKTKKQKQRKKTKQSTRPTKQTKNKDKKHPTLIDNFIKFSTQRNCIHSFLMLSARTVKHKIWKTTTNKINEHLNQEELQNLQCYGGRKRNEFVWRFIMIFPESIQLCLRLLITNWRIILSSPRNWNQSTFWAH